MKRVAVVYMALLIVATFAFGVSAKTSVDFWYWSGGAVQTYIVDNLLPRFHEENPDIEIVPQLIPQRYDLLQKLLISAAGDSLPAFALFDPIWLPQFSPMIMAFEDLAKKDGPEMMDVIADLNPASHMMVSYNDKVYLSTFGVFELGLFYNKDLFEEAGVVAEIETWDDMVETAKKLTRDKNNDGTIDVWGLRLELSKYKTAQTTWIAMLWSNGGDVFNDDFTKCTLDSKEAIETLRWYGDLQNKHKVASVVADPDWLSGGAAMQVHGNWDIHGYAPVLGNSLGAMAMPRGKAQHATYAHGDSYAIFKTSPEKQEAAWTFVKWLQSPEIATDLAIIGGVLPARESVAETGKYQSYLQQNPLIQVFVDQLEHARVSPPVEAMNRAYAEIGTAMDKVLYEKATPERALKDARSNVEMEME